jgi:hypothetical protein
MIMFSSTIVRISPLIVLSTFSSVHAFASIPTRAHKHQTKLQSWNPSSPEQIPLSNQLSITPLDKYNAALLNEVHPLNYTNPEVDWGEVWDLVVVGAGAGGLVSSRQVG